MRIIKILCVVACLSSQVLAQDDSLYFSPLMVPDSLAELGRLATLESFTVLYLRGFDSINMVLVHGETYSDTTTGAEFSSLMNWAHKHWCYNCGCEKVYHKLGKYVKGTGLLCPKHENWWDNERSK